MKVLTLLIGIHLLGIVNLSRLNPARDKSHLLFWLLDIFTYNYIEQFIKGLIIKGSAGSNAVKPL